MITTGDMVVADQKLARCGVAAVDAATSNASSTKPKLLVADPEIQCRCEIVEPRPSGRRGQEREQSEDAESSRRWLS